MDGLTQILLWVVLGVLVLGVWVFEKTVNRALQRKKRNRRWLGTFQIDVSSPFFLHWAVPPSSHPLSPTTPKSSFLNSQVAILRGRSELQWRIWDGMRISGGGPSREGRWGSGRERCSPRRWGGSERVERGMVEGERAFCWIFKPMGLKSKDDYWRAVQNGPRIWQSTTSFWSGQRLTSLLCCGWRIKGS